MSKTPISEFPLPLWVAGPSRRIDRERRKNPGALHRHAQVINGTPTVRHMRRRQMDLHPPAVERVINLWS